MEIIKNFKADVLISAVLCILLGIIVMIWPTEVTVLLCKVLAIILIIMGSGHILQYFMDRNNNRIGFASGFVILLLGVWIFTKPTTVVQIIPIIIGVLLLMHGLEDLRLAMEAREFGDSKWWSALVVAMINLLFGVILIWKSLTAVAVTMWLVGLALVYDGITDLVIVLRVRKVTKESK